MWATLWSNPTECEVCGHTLFRPLPADGAGGGFDGGKEQTQLGDDISTLVDKIDTREPEQPTTGSNEQAQSTDEQNTNSSFLSRLWPF